MIPGSRPGTDESLEAHIRNGVVSALRKRAAHQATIARDGAAATAAGVIIRSGESAIAAHLAEALAAAANDIERTAP